MTHNVKPEQSPEDLAWHRTAPKIFSGKSHVIIILSLTRMTLNFNPNNHQKI